MTADMTASVRTGSQASPSSSLLSQGLPHRESGVWLLSYSILHTQEEGNFQACLPKWLLT